MLTDTSLHTTVDCDVLIIGGGPTGVTLASLRDAIAYVGQESLLFDDTVEANIRMGRPGATEAEVRAAAAEQLNGQVAELVVGSLQLMVGHMVGTRVVPREHSQRVMRWVSVEQESQVLVAVAVATGVAKVVHNMVAVAGVLVGPLATWFLYATLRGIATEMVY